MAEYIEREAAIKMIENDLPEQVRYYKQDAIDCLQCMPTADVVPKSEVEYMTKEEIVQIIGEADKYCKNTSCTKCKFNEIKTPYCWWYNIAEHIYTAQNTNNFGSRQTIEGNEKKYTESEDKE